MALTEKQLDELSQEVLKAEKSAKAITNFTDRFPEITVAEAYAIQVRSLKTRIKNSDVIVGRKIGLCAKANQQMFGINEPIYGHLFASMVVPEVEPISMSRLLRPVIEGEICFVLKDDLRGPGVNVAKVLAATAGIMPAIEIADSRFKERRMKAQDTISENSGAAMVVLGGKITPVADIDLRLVGMVLEKNGEVIATGAGAAVLGNPAQSVAQLANKLAEFGMSMSAGEFIISGSLTAAFPAEAGSCFRATFDRLSSVSVRFIS
jgi:2-oxopent-4-enoate hydratase